MSMICSIVPNVKRFSHEEAMQVYEQALQQPDSEQVLVDLRRASDATTSGFARLVLLRKELRAEGRDLCLTNMRDRVAQLYRINRLDSVLPQMKPNHAN